MKKSGEPSAIELRLVVGYLGEQAQFTWWPSKFFAPESGQFLDHIFSKTADLAHYNGVTEAARIAHVEHIGIGRVFHAFRLPEVMEQLFWLILLRGPIAADKRKSSINTTADRFRH
jgi:hypothetical protein